VLQDPPHQQRELQQPLLQAQVLLTLEKQDGTSGQPA